MKSLFHSGVYIDPSRERICFGVEIGQHGKIREEIDLARCGLTFTYKQSRAGVRPETYIKYLTVGTVPYLMYCTYSTIHTSSTVHTVA